MEAGYSLLTVETGTSWQFTNQLYYLVVLKVCPLVASWVWVLSWTRKTLPVLLPLEQSTPIFIVFTVPVGLWRFMHESYISAWSELSQSVRMNLQQDSIADSRSRPSIHPALLRSASNTAFYRWSRLSNHTNNSNICPNKYPKKHNNCKQPQTNLITLILLITLNLLVDSCSIFPQRNLCCL